MTQEDKELLLRDLCGRVPYSVKCNHLDWDINKQDYITRISILYAINSDYIPCFKYVGDDGCHYISESEFDIENIKPYLFPMSSMTEEQKIECFKGTDIELDEYNEIWSKFPISETDIPITNLSNWLRVIDWLNKHHFDYRGLIEKGLAIDTTRLNIY